MCLYPVKVKNPYYSKDVFQYYEGEIIETSKRLVSKRQYMDVPCGKCPECRNSYFVALQQRAQMESLTSYVYMVTLTYNDKHIPYISCLGEDNSEIRINYANVEHIQDMFKRLRNHPRFIDRDFRYLGVTEYGSARFRPHHHILLFVGRKSTDDKHVPFEFEAFLFNTLRKLYSVNLGTRKNPQYEEYFTFAERFINGKWNRNYDVRLVVPYEDKYHLPDYTTEHAVAAATAYITTYVNKPSLIDELLEPMLCVIKDNIEGELYAKRVMRLLRCRVYYSKHFGFGFDCYGKKVNPSLRSHLVSPAILQRSQFVAVLPNTFDELVDKYPVLARKVEQRMNFYRSAFIYHFNTTYHYLESLNDNEVMNFFLVLKYFPKAIESFYHNNGFTSMSYYPKLLPVTDYDSSYTKSRTYLTLRISIREGIAQRLPYLAFPFLTKNGIKYMPMCKYFRKYVSCVDDTLKMYDSLGVKDYDEYISKFDPDIRRSAQLARQQKCNENWHELMRSVDPDALTNYKHKIANIITISPSVYDIINP